MAESSCPVWINGEPADGLAVSDRGLAYGDGVFETIRCLPRTVLLEHHLDRLSQGVSALGIPLDLAALSDSLMRYQSQHSPGLIKVIVTRGSGGRGYQPPENPSPNVIIQGFDVPAYQDEWYQTGICLYLCQTPLATNSALQGIKHLNRLEQVLARREFSGDTYQEGLMGNEAFGLVEGTVSNLFLIKDETLLMPPLAACAVRGTMQRFIVESCQALGHSCRELDAVNLTTLVTADRVFLCNSVFGLWPVKQIMSQELKPVESVLFDQIQHKAMSLFS